MAELCLLPTTMGRSDGGLRTSNSFWILIAAQYRAVDAIPTQEQTCLYVRNNVYCKTSALAKNSGDILGQASFIFFNENYTSYLMNGNSRSFARLSFYNC